MALRHHPEGAITDAWRTAPAQRVMLALVASIHVLTIAFDG